MKTSEISLMIVAQLFQQIQFVPNVSVGHLVYFIYCNRGSTSSGRIHFYYILGKVASLLN
jgi:hypothetical protein